VKKIPSAVSLQLGKKFRRPVCIKAYSSFVMFHFVSGNSSIYLFVNLILQGGMGSGFGAIAEISFCVFLIPQKAIDGKHSGEAYSIACLRALNSEEA